MAQASGQPGRRVLVVEDEASILRGLSDVLRFRGYTVLTAEDGNDGLRLALAERLDLIVLDVMLPGQSGYVVCERLRRAGCETPVLMLTAKGDEDDVVRGFEAGANDYVTKPFGVRELLARMDALLRRPGSEPAGAFRCGPLEIDPERAEAHDGALRATLSPREVRILRLLCREPGRIVSRRTLLRDAWDMNNADQVETRTVDVHIAKLRKKLGAHGELIETVRGQGYRLCP
jgi:DNA-binding response OmpR family regulator